MAIVKCAECGADISDTAKACPHCGAPAKKAIKKSQRLAKIIVLTLGAVWIYSIFSGSSSSDNAHTFGESEALVICQQAIRSVAKDPEKADIPAIKGGLADDGTYVFHWGGSTRMARMRNGLGLEVAVTADCAVHKDTHKLTRLVIDGKDII